MRKILTLLFASLFILSISSCGSASQSALVQPQSDDSGQQVDSIASSSDKSITALKLIASSENVDLDAGDSKSGYFKVEGGKSFSVDDDIEFVSSDPSIATFVYDQTSLEVCVYYKINALSAGTASVYAQTTDGNIKTDAITVNVTGYIYDIVKFDDTSIPNAERMTLRVTADESYLYSMTDEQLSEMVKYIADNYASSHKMNAIVVYLYCNGDDTEGAFTIASCTYAPDGEIENAPNVEAVDYSSFDYDIHINSESERKLYRGK